MVRTGTQDAAEMKSQKSLLAKPERAKAALRNAGAMGKRLGRPKGVIDPARIAALRKSGLGWKKISKELGVGVGTVPRIAQEASEGGSRNPKAQTFRTFPRTICNGSTVAARVGAFR
jgi:DNA invertase Pin-like site-specific DNA recombinase